MRKLSGSLELFIVFLQKRKDALNDFQSQIASSNSLHFFRKNEAKNRHLSRIALLSRSFEMTRRAING